ncbi:hypothetical protein M0R01_00500 [bacterium]|nr:hypothetical protein [bacterium]
MKNILGWLLIVIGLVIIFGDIFATYNYFTGKDKFPEIFKEQSISNNIPTGISSGGNDMQNQISEAVNNAVKDQLSKTFPSSSITLMLNASLWSIFAFFLISAGGKLVEVGGKLLVSSKKERE